MTRAPALAASLLSLAAVACDGDAPSSIQVSTGTEPALIALRDGLDAPWQRLTARSPGRYEREVHGPYQLVVVCDAGDGASTTYQVARTPEDPRTIELSCARPSSAHPVTGTMIQPGVVRLGARDYDQSLSSPWSFELFTEPGTFDLVAISDDRAVLRRDLVVQGPVEVSPAIDVEAEGVQLVAAPLVVPNADDAAESVTAHISLSTRGTPFVAVFTGDPSGGRALPAGALAAGDQQLAKLTARSGPSERSLQRPLDGDDTFVLPAPLGAVRFSGEAGQLAAQWTTTPPYDELQLWANGESANGASRAFHTLQLTARFVEATGESRARLDSEILGFEPRWRVDLSRPHERQLAAMTVGETRAVSSYAERFQPLPDAP
ncbi:MAG: hypothetical protein ACTHU0_40100 [Kofleriaceae bacterium]